MRHFTNDLLTIVNAWNRRSWSPTGTTAKGLDVAVHVSPKHPELAIGRSDAHSADPTEMPSTFEL